MSEAERTKDSESFVFESSFGQQRLWFLDQYEPGTGQYNVAKAWRVRGALDQQVLVATLNEVLRRHEALRTVFAPGADGPMQIIAQPVLALERLNLSERAEALALAQRHVDAEAARPFDLLRGPMLRALLIALGPNDHVLMLTLHHIVCDGWSMGILARELGALYGAFAAGSQSPLPELSIQYADFAVWQRNRLRGPVLQEQAQYWRDYLLGPPAALELPTDRPRRAELTHRGDRVEFEVGAQVAATLRGFNQRFQATLFMTLAAAFNVLLSRYSGQHDICIGYPVANRNRPELETLIGFFVNTLVLRTRVMPQHSFVSVLQQVRESVLDGDAHQDLPFEKLVEEMRPERSLSRSPLFQVMLALDNTADDDLALAGLEVETLHCENSAAKFELSLDMTERAGRLHGAFSYNADLFDRGTIERMAGHFRALLEAVAADPGTTVGSLPMLDREELQQLLVQWNDTAADTGERWAHQLFEEQAKKHPDLPAVAFDDAQLTYAELNVKANQLAHYLNAAGAGPDTLVGLYVERSLDMVIAMMAILKAGAAYLPLDPLWPLQRLQFMLEDSGTTRLVTHSALEPLLGPCAAQVIRLDADRAAIARMPVVDPTHAVQANHLAYCIYTSGSTGVPKGVLISQRSLVDHLVFHAGVCRFGTGERVLQFAPIHFDASVEELFAPLIAGALVVLRPAQLNAADEIFDEFLHAARINVLGLPTAFWHQWAFEMRQGRCRVPPSVRLVVVGGELARWDSLDGWLQATLPGGCRWMNTYGPTEATVSSSSHEVSAADSLPDGVDPPIGRPNANTQIYILDDALNLVPRGATGEIHIAGTGLARGYLARPALTAQSFIPNPFGPPGSRMYKSGDFARHLPDGSIEFRRRLDDQVKVRGFRIEIGEVESALLACAGVRGGAVLAFDACGGDKRLVAYVVAHESPPVTAADLRAQLQKRLPEYMVPASYVFLPALPLNANGKIDRNALPRAEARRSDLGAPYVAPRTPTELLLAGIWAEVLKIDQVGVDDNFFELGGHSLLATQLVARIVRALARRVHLRQVFLHPTVARLARYLDESSAPSLPQATASAALGETRR